MKKLFITIAGAIITAGTLNAQTPWFITGNAGTNTSTNFIGTTDSKALKFRTNNAVRMTMTSGGKIGIGTTSPVFKLDVKGGSINTDSAYRIGGVQVLSRRTGNMVQLGDSTAIVGIGTTTPAERLEVNGTVYSSSGGFKFPDATVQVTAASSATLANLQLSNLASTSINGDLLPDTHNTRDLGTSSKAWKNIYARGGYFLFGLKVLDILGTDNVFIGYTNNTTNTAHDITAVGSQALKSNTTGNANTAIGRGALTTNSSGDGNTACGYQALVNNTSGYYNTSTGTSSLFSNTTGFNNVANGLYSLLSNTTGHSNSACGLQSLYYYTTGFYNSAIGRDAGNSNGTSPSNFTALGYNAGHVGSGSNSIEIGNTSVSWIGGMTNWFTYFSDRRIKENIQSNVPGLSFITKLNPVTYNVNIHKQSEICGITDTNEWEGKYDIEKIVQTGFLAQEVEQAAKECNYDFDGVVAPTGNRKLYSVSYASFVMPLVKAVQELDLKMWEMENLKMENEKLKSDNEMIISVLSEEQQQKLKALREGKSRLRGDIEGHVFQNSPNPFNFQTEIKFQLPSSFSSAQLIITDANGRQMRKDDLIQSSSVIIKASEFSSGTYSYSLFIDGVNVDTKQMILTK